MSAASERIGYWIYSQKQYLLFKFDDSADFITGNIEIFQTCIWVSSTTLQSCNYCPNLMTVVCPYWNFSSSRDYSIVMHHHLRRVPYGLLHKVHLLSKYLRLSSTEDTNSFQSRDQIMTTTTATEEKHSKVSSWRGVPDVDIWWR